MDRRSGPLFLLLLAGCQDYLFEQKFPEQIKQSQIVRPAATPTPADILFVVDNSGSMQDEQENLAANFQSFINQIKGAGDYQIAVVTTDLKTMGGEVAGLADFGYSGTQPYNYLTGSTRGGCQNLNVEHGCFRGGTKIITSALPPADQVSLFQQNVQVGSCGSGDEQGLAAMIRALEQTRGGCNAGFLRDDANLVVILVSDEENFDRNVPVEQFLNQLGQFKPYTRLRFAAIVGSVDGNPSNCRIVNGQASAMCGQEACGAGMPQSSNTACATPSQCGPDETCSMGRCTHRAANLWFNNTCFSCSYFNTPSCCSANSADHYVEFARALEGRVAMADSTIPRMQCRAPAGTPAACLVDSICQANFGDTLARIARELVVTNKYSLEPPASYPPGVVVRVKGGRFGPEGKELVYSVDFTVSADGGTLVIQGENTPREGESVEIYFVIAN